MSVNRVLALLCALLVLVLTVHAVELSVDTTTNVRLRSQASTTVSSRSNPDGSIEFVEIDVFDGDQVDQLTEPCPSGCNSNGTFISLACSSIATSIELQTVYILSLYSRCLPLYSLPLLVPTHSPSLYPLLPLLSWLLLLALCNFAGVCTQDGQCFCYDGFTGPDCAIPACPAACAQHGECVKGECICKPGWAGYDCSYRGCKDDCNGHGACHIGPYASKCICFSGYSGETCNNSIPSLTNDVGCKNDCSSQGKCVNSSCVCNPGFVGAYCQQRECKHSCHGRGVCDQTTGKCRCLDTLRYGGDFCETLQCPNNCFGNGECLPTGACKCNDGFFGSDCSPRNCREDCNYPNGRCVVKPQKTTVTDPVTGNVTDIVSMAAARGVCECHPLFKGETCNQARCPLDCSGKGTCDLSTYMCKCEKGFGGAGCQYATCKKKCVHGSCLDGKCACDSNYKGEDCSEPWTCPKDCSGNGPCHNGKCYCKDGYEGEDCSMKSSDASVAKPPPPIQQGGCNPGCVSGQGACVLVQDKFQCVCKGGFTGATCAEKGVYTRPRATNDLTKCDPPCSSPGGHCIQLDTITPAQCICSPGYSGVTCSIAPPPTPASEEGDAPAPAAPAGPTPTTPAATPAAPTTPTTPTAAAVESQSTTTTTTSSPSSSSSSSSSPSSLMEIGAVMSGANSRNNQFEYGSSAVLYEETEAMRMAQALEDDQREDAMLLQALDQITNY